jgi:hypothetical protein
VSPLVFAERVSKCWPIGILLEIAMVIWFTWYGQLFVHARRKL